MEYIPPVLEIVRDNILKKGNPLGLPAKDFTEWAKGLNIPNRGDRILYTGLEYQMMPYSYGLLDMVKKAGPFGDKMGLAGKVKGVFEKIGLDLTKAFSTAKNRETFTKILILFAKTFQKLNINFAYLYEDEPYAGALLYEFGFVRDLVDYGKRIKQRFEDFGIRELVVLSPHSLEMFRKIYPELGVNFNLKISHYTEILLENYKNGSVETKEVAIHDPCHLARSLKMTEEPRSVLARIRGLTLREVPHTNKLYTTCCGAPVETYLPMLTELLSGQRLDEFEKAGIKNVLVLCPFCYFNLEKEASSKKRDIRVIDFIEIASESLGG